MEVQEMVKYGNRVVKYVRTEVGARQEDISNTKERFKPDFSLAEEYERFGLPKQAKVAREEAIAKAALAKEEAQREYLKEIGFRLLSKYEVIKIGLFFAEKTSVQVSRGWRVRGDDDAHRGILSSFVAVGFDSKDRRCEYSCNPWVKLEEMETELIPLRIIEALTSLRPFFDNIYIASTGNAEKSLTQKIIAMRAYRAYDCPVAVGVKGNDIALLARWGNYPRFLDPEREIRYIFWKLLANLMFLLFLGYSMYLLWIYRQGMMHYSMPLLGE